MQITGLPASSAFGASDVLAIEINGVTYKITGATLAAALQSMGDYVIAQDIANNLTTTDEGYVLDARQGKALLDALDAIGAVQFNEVQNLTAAQTLQARRNIEAGEAMAVNVAGARLLDGEMFQRGSLDSGVVTDTQWRVVTTKIHRLPFAITLTAQDGFRFGVTLYTSAGEYSSDSGWKTTYTIPRYSFFRMTIARTSESTSETANIAEFVASISAQSQVVREIDIAIDNISDDMVVTETITVDKSNCTKIAAYMTAAGLITSKNNCNVIYFACQPGITYTISKVVSARFRVGYSTVVPANTVKASGVIHNNTGSEISITPAENARYLVVYYYDGDNDTISESEIYNSIVITYEAETTELTAFDKVARNEASGKVAIQQGSGNAGKALVVGLDGYVTTGNAGIPEAVKVSILNLARHVAYIDDQGQTYYDALYDAFYPDTGLSRISAVFVQDAFTVYPNTPINDLKPYLTVTGYYRDGTTRIISDYILTGTLTAGISVITVLSDGKTTTFDVNVTALPILRVYVGKGIAYDSTTQQTPDNPKRCISEKIPFNNVAPIIVQWELNSAYRFSIKNEKADGYMDTTGASWFPDNYSEEAQIDTSLKGWIFSNSENYVVKKVNGEMVPSTWESTSGYCRILMAPKSGMNDPLPSELPAGFITVTGITYEIQIVQE